MSVIENFAELSVEEQRKFAEALVKTINSESIFTDETNFKVVGVEADDHTGGLHITLEPEDVIEVQREATWTCEDSEDANSTPDDPDFADSIFGDAKSAFKVLAADIEGYSVTLSIDDVDEEDIIDVDADSISEEDSGIGHYEYFGYSGYDSQPYCEVEGTILQACTVYCSLYVEAADYFEVDVEEDNAADGDFDPEGRRTEKPWGYGEHFDD